MKIALKFVFVLMLAVTIMRWPNAVHASTCAPGYAACAQTCSNGYTECYTRCNNLGNPWTCQQGCQSGYSNCESMCTQEYCH
jgi:hypothetical protein